MESMPSYNGLEKTGPESEAIGTETPEVGTSSSNRSKGVGSGNTKSTTFVVSSRNELKLATNGTLANVSVKPKASGKL